MANEYTREQRAQIVGDNEQISTLLEQCKRNSTHTFRRVLSQGRANERIASGNNPEQLPRTGVNSYANQDQPRAPQQVLQNLVLTWSALVTKDRPSVYAVPSSTDLSAVSASKIYTKVIEYTEQEEDVQRKWTTTAEAAAYAGTGFMYIVYDPELARVTWRPMSVHDVILDDRPEIRDVMWCVTREYIDEWTAEAIIASVPDSEPSDSTPETEKYQDGSGDEHEGVPKYTIWYRPCSRFPTGLYACIVGDTVVESTEYPYVFPDADGGKVVSLLPVVWWHCRTNRGSPLGLTWASDVAPLQIALNELNSKLLRNAQQAQSYLVLPQSMQSNEGFDPQNGIVYAPVSGDVKPEWISPSPLDPNQMAEKTNLIQSMYDSAGISPQTSGQGGSSSGRQLAYQAELDAQKHAASFKSLEVAIQNSWILDLKLKQKFYSVPQQMALSDGGSPLVWSGADIAGIDVRLENRSARDGAQSSKIAKSREDVAAGFAPVESLAANNPTPASAASQYIAADLIDRLMAGEDVQIGPESADPATLIAEIDKRIEEALLGRDLELARQLSDFKAQLQRDLAMASAPSAEPTGAPPAAAAPPLPESIAAEGAQVQ